MRNNVVKNLHNLCMNYELRPEVEEGIDSAILEIIRLENIIKSLVYENEAKAQSIRIIV